MVTVMSLMRADIQDFRFDGEYIHFWMQDVCAHVSCAVKSEFLSARAAKDGIADQSYRSLFILYRKEIEAFASEKYGRGIERPVVTVMDLEWRKLVPEPEQARGQVGQ
jgi:hypothetical protein